MDAKDIKQQLKSEYKYKIEMHAHTKPASTCSEISPEKMIEMYKPLGYDAIVLTNHFIHGYNLFEQYSVDDAIDAYINEYEQLAEYGAKAGIKIILGSEIRFTENNNDYLVYGVDKQMLKEIYELLPYGIENFRKTYQMPNSVFLQAHPFRDGMEHVDPKLLDGIEIMNMHQGHNSRISIATRYATDYEWFIKTAGSDIHHIGKGHEGASAMRFKTMPKDSFELAAILKTKDYIFELGGDALVLPY